MNKETRTRIENLAGSWGYIFDMLNVEMGYDVADDDDSQICIIGENEDGEEQLYEVRLGHDADDTYWVTDIVAVPWEDEE